MEIKGKLSMEALRTLVGTEAIETVVVAFTDHYGRLVGKRCAADFFVEEVATAGTHACNYLLTTDMEMEPVAGYALANWEKGYGDFHLVPDLATLRLADWLDKTALVLCDVHQPNHQPENIAPRGVLKKQLAALQEEGFRSAAASELEYYLFEHSYRQAHEQHYQDLKPVGWYREDYHILQGTRTEEFTGRVRRHLQRSGIPVETSKGEWGLGQHELNIRYAEALEMADRHVVYKQCLKEVADSLGYAVTFMAKYAEDQAGSSCHLHLSLWRNGENAFAGTEDFGGLACSDTFRWFLGGWLRYTPELMPFFAPTVNSYKRFQDASWAPTRLAWSCDNRTAGFRVVGQGASLRIECRLPGADCNPYLAFAAALAAGLQGIKDKTEPPAAFVGDAYAAEGLPLIPTSLAAATARFEASDFAKNAFGEDVVQHYAHFFRTECQAYERAVTDWERKRYFEQI